MCIYKYANDVPYMDFYWYGTFYVKYEVSEVLYRMQKEQVN